MQFWCDWFTSGVPLTAFLIIDIRDEIMLSFKLVSKHNFKLQLSNKDDNARFTTVPLKTWYDQVWIGYPCVGYPYVGYPCVVFLNCLFSFAGSFSAKTIFCFMRNREIIIIKSYPSLKKLWYFPRNCLDLSFHCHLCNLHLN